MSQKQMFDKGDRASEFRAEIYLRIEGKTQILSPFFLMTHCLANYVGGDQNECVYVKLVAEDHQ